MNSKSIKISAVLAVSVLLTYYALSPWIAIWQLREAARASDAVALEEYVDFPALKESIKAWATVSMMKKMDEPEMRANPFAGLGIMLANSLIGTMVDSMVTPAGIAAIASGNFRQALPKGDVKAADASTAGKPAFFESGMRYTSINRFVFEHSKGDATFQMHFRRGGIGDWKLYAVTLPAL